MFRTRGSSPVSDARCERVFSDTSRCSSGASGHAVASIEEQAERMTGGVEEDANIVLWLELGKGRASRDRMLDRVREVVHPQIQVQHLRWVPRLLRPHRRLVPGL